MRGQAWEVVGGADKGGIVVRASRELTSEQLPQKLATASRVAQLARVGDRLHYRLVEGQGPEEGWVSVKLKDKELLRPCKPSPAAASAAASTAASTAASAVASPGTDAREEALPQTPDKGAGDTSPRPRSSPAASPPSARAQAPRGGGSSRQPEVPQMPVAEAMQLQDTLRNNIAAKGFQEGLRKLQRKYPQRKQRGHAHGPAYFQAFESLVLTVFCRVLPKYGIRGDWDGVQELHGRMSSALRNNKVRKQQEELNTLLGLPRDAVLFPPKKSEEAFVFREAGDGGAPGPVCPLVVDEDGDEAHEFFVEDPDTGELCSITSSS